MAYGASSGRRVGRRKTFIVLDGEEHACLLSGSVWCLARFNVSSFETLEWKRERRKHVKRWSKGESPRENLDRRYLVARL